MTDAASRNARCGADGGLEAFARRRMRPIRAKNRSTTQQPRVNGEADPMGFLRTI